MNDLVQVISGVCDAQHCTATLLGPGGAPSASARRSPNTQPAGHRTEALHLGLRNAVLAGEIVHRAQGDPHPVFSGGVGPELAAGAVLAVPLTVAGRVVGGVWLVRAAPGLPFGTVERDWAVAIADLTAATVDRLRQDGGSPDVLEELASRHLDVEPETGFLPFGGSDETGNGVASVYHPFDGGGQQSLVSQLVRRLTAKARTIVGTQAMILSRIEGDRQTFLVIDAEPGVVPAGEGFEMSVEDTYCGMLLSGELPPVIPDVWRHPLTAQHPMTGPLRMGAYCGAPVILPDGTVFGTLAGVDYRPAAPLSSARLHALQALAELIGLQVHKENQQQCQRTAQREAFRVFMEGDVRTTVLQPIVNLSSGRVSGYEALSRFSRTVTGAPRRPDEVFARAARLGMSVELEQACATSALELVHRLVPGSYLSINVSPRTLVHRATLDLFKAQNLQQVVVELTEHEQIDDYGAVAAVVDDLRRHGARIAVDDLGAGFAGLQHLARLRPEVVKLDISFVRNVDTDPTRAAVARAVAGFAAEIGATLVAEGVETQAEKARLKQLGATHGQGYLLGRPASVQEVLPTYGSSEVAAS